MSRSIEVNYTGEGTVDGLVARRIISAAGHRPGRDYVSNRRVKGKSGLDASLKGLNAGAPFGNPVLVLRDLDGDAPCAGALVQDLAAQHMVGGAHPAVLVRIAVRSVEAWLLADACGFAKASGVPSERIPAQPEGLGQPKNTLWDLLRKYGNRQTRSALRLAGPDDRPTGQMLAGWTAEFAAEFWDVERAALSGRAPSLSRCLDRLRHLSNK